MRFPQVIASSCLLFTKFLSHIDTLLYFLTLKETAFKPIFVDNESKWFSKGRTYITWCSSTFWQSMYNSENLLYSYIFHQYGWRSYDIILQCIFSMIWNELDLVVFNKLHLLYAIILLRIIILNHFKVS